MASVSVSHMILFIASIVIAASVAGVFTDSISQVSQAIDDRGLSVSQNVRTDIEVISDSGSAAVYNETTNNVTIYVKNTGSRDLRPESAAIDVLVDGQYEDSVTVSLLGEDVEWDPGDVVQLEISPNNGDGLGSGDHRLKVIVNEDEEVFRFRV